MTAFNPTLRQLRYLVQLHETRHFGRAAAALGVGQSTLSAGIAELERLIGVQLVERTNRSVHFTELGDTFVGRAHGVIEASDALTQFAVTSAEPLTGTLRLGIIPTIAPFLLPRLLGATAAHCPDLTLRLREATSEIICAALHSGALDAIILALPFDCGRVVIDEIMRDPLHLGVPAAWGDAAFDPDRLLLLEDGHCLNEHGLSGCGVSRVKAAAMVATSLHTLVEMVDAGLGTMILPELAINAGIIGGRRIRLRPLADGSERQIVLAWRPESARARDLATLGTLLADIVAK